MDWARIERQINEETHLRATSRFQTSNSAQFQLQLYTENSQITPSIPKESYDGKENISYNDDVNDRKDLIRLIQRTCATHIQPLEQEIKRLQVYNSDLLRKAEDLQIKNEQFEHDIQYLRGNQSDNNRELHTLALSSKKTLSQCERLTDQTSQMQEKLLTKEFYLKMAESQTFELSKHQNYIDKLTNKISINSTQCENLLLSLFDVAGVPQAENQLDLLSSLSSEGFSNQIRQVLADTLQMGIESSVQSHMKHLQDMLGQSIAVMLKDFRERQDNELQGHKDTVNKLIIDTNTIRAEVTDVLKNILVIKNAHSFTMTTTANPSLQAVEELETRLRQDLESLQKRIREADDRSSSLSEQVAIHTTTLGNTAAANEIARKRMDEQLQRILNKQETLVSDFDWKLERLETKVLETCQDKLDLQEKQLKDLKDNHLHSSLDFSSFKEKTDKLFRNYAQSTTKDILQLREESRVALHVMKLEQEEMKRDVAVVQRNAEVSTYLQEQESLSSLNSVKLDVAIKRMSEEHESLVERIKSLSAELQESQTKALSERDDIHKLLTDRDVQTLIRVQERLSTWESLQRDWQSIQESRMQELNRSFTSLTDANRLVKVIEDLEQARGQVSALQERLAGVSAKQDSMDADLRREKDFMKTELSRTLQDIQTKLVAERRIFGEKLQSVEESSLSVSRRASSEVEQLRDQLTEAQSKFKSSEYEVQGVTSSLLRLDQKVVELGIQSEKAVDLKLSSMDERLSANIHKLVSDHAKSESDLTARIALLRKDMDAVEESHAGSFKSFQAQVTSSISGVSAECQGKCASLETSIDQLTSANEATTSELNSNLSAIAQQQLQFSDLAAQLQADLSEVQRVTQRNKDLSAIELTALRDKIRNDIVALQREYRDTQGEIKFDLSQLLNRAQMRDQLSAHGEGFSESSEIARSDASDAASSLGAVSRTAPHDDASFSHSMVHLSQKIRSMEAVLLELKAPSLNVIESTLTTLEARVDEVAVVAKRDADSIRRDLEDMKRELATHGEALQTIDSTSPSHDQVASSVASEASIAQQQSEYERERRQDESLTALQKRISDIEIENETTRRLLSSEDSKQANILTNDVRALEQGLHDFESTLEQIQTKCDNIARDTASAEANIRDLNRQFAELPATFDHSSKAAREEVSGLVKALEDRVNSLQEAIVSQPLSLAPATETSPSTLASIRSLEKSLDNLLPRVKTMETSLSKLSTSVSTSSSSSSSPDPSLVALIKSYENIQELFEMRLKALDENVSSLGNIPSEHFSLKRTIASLQQEMLVLQEEIGNLDQQLQGLQGGPGGAQQEQQQQESVVSKVAFEEFEQRQMLSTRDILLQVVTEIKDWTLNSLDPIKQETTGVKRVVDVLKGETSLLLKDFTSINEQFQEINNSWCSFIEEKDRMGKEELMKLSTILETSLQAERKDSDTQRSSSPSPSSLSGSVPLSAVEYGMGLSFSHRNSTEFGGPGGSATASAPNRQNILLSPMSPENSVASNSFSTDAMTPSTVGLLSPESKAITNSSFADIERNLLDQLNVSNQSDSDDVDEANFVSSDDESFDDGHQFPLSHPNHDGLTSIKSEPSIDLPEVRYSENTVSEISPVEDKSSLVMNPTDNTTVKDEVLEKEVVLEEKMTEEVLTVASNNNPKDDEKADEKGGENDGIEAEDDEDEQDASRDPQAVPAPVAVVMSGSLGTAASSMNPTLKKSPNNNKKKKKKGKK